MIIVLWPQSSNSESNPTLSIFLPPLKKYDSRCIALYKLPLVSHLGSVPAMPLIFLRSSAHLDPDKDKVVTGDEWKYFLILW